MRVKISHILVIVKIRVMVCVCVCVYHGGHREEVWVVAALLQVHHDVEQRHLVSSTLGVESLKVLGQY